MTHWVRAMMLEGRSEGIEGKKQLWTTLRDIAELETRLPNINFEELITRAEGQREELEPFRTRTGKAAFITSPTRQT